MNVHLRRGAALAVVLASVAWVAGCTHRRAENAKTECVRNMEIIWGAAGSYCLENKKAPDFVCSVEMLAAYMKDGHAPRCPLGEIDYEPFTVSTGPSCPNRPDVHLGHRYPK